MYGAIKSINVLGPTHIINIILPKLDQILNCLVSETGNNLNNNSFINVGTLNMNGKTKFANQHTSFNEDKSLNPSQNSNVMMVDAPSFGNSVPKITFSLPPFISNYPISSSIFSEISNTNVIDINKENKVMDEENKVLTGILKSKNVPINSKKAFYVYYALKVKFTFLFLKKIFLFFFRSLPYSCLITQKI